jgi:hypothetical protein
LPQFDRDLETARQELGDADASAAWAEGQALTLEQAVACALEEANRDDTRGPGFRAHGNSPIKPD